MERTRITSDENGCPRLKCQQVIERSRLGRQHEGSLGESHDFFGHTPLVSIRTTCDPDLEPAGLKRLCDSRPTPQRITFMDRPYATAGMKQNEVSTALTSRGTQAGRKTSLGQRRGT